MVLPVKDRLIAAGIAAVCLLVGLITFVINYLWFHGSLPGYRLLLAPGIFVLGFFTEEIDFWPKLALLLGGQFLLCFLVAALILQGRALLGRWQR